MTSEEMLARLVAFPTVVARPNLDLIAFVEDWLRRHGVAPVRVPGPEGDRVNLFATIGPADVPGTILSGHVDVVPADEPGWLGDPFVLRRDGERLIGRGTTDMKGFVACLLAAVPDLVRRPLAAPVHLALSYDEEAGCVGVRHLIARLPALCVLPAACIVGEPTGLRPLLAHKGKASIRVTARGIPGHSSRPDLGENAIHALVPVLAAATRLARELEAGPLDVRFAPPYCTAQVGTLSGGRALNIIPEAAEAEIELRVIPGVDPLDALGPVLDAVAADPALAHEVIAAYPPMSLDAGSPLARLAVAVTGREPVAAESFGTEAGLYQAAGIASVVCGPGQIGRAHKPEEHVTLGELADTDAMLAHLADRLSQ